MSYSSQLVSPRPMNPVINWNDPLAHGLIAAVPFYSFVGTSGWRSIVPPLWQTLSPRPDFSGTDWGWDTQVDPVHGRGLSQVSNTEVQQVDVLPGIVIPEDKFTVAIWHRTNPSITTTEGDSDSFMMNNGPAGDWLRLRHGATTRFDWRGGGFAFNTIDGLSNTAMSDILVHWVFVIDNDTTNYIFNIYWDGAPYGSASPTNAVQGSVIFDNFGGPSVSAGNYGATYDLRLWNRPLTAQEAQNLYSPLTRWDLYQESKPYRFAGIGVAPPPPTDQVFFPIRR